MALYESQSKGGSRMPKFQQAAKPQTDIEQWRAVNRAAAQVQQVVQAHYGGGGERGNGSQPRTYPLLQQQPQMLAGMRLSPALGGSAYQFNQQVPKFTYQPSDYYGVPVYPQKANYGLMPNNNAALQTQNPWLPGSVYGGGWPSNYNVQPGGVSAFASTGGQDWTKYSPGISASGVIGPNTQTTPPLAFGPQVESAGGRKPRQPVTAPELAGSRQPYTVIPMDNAAYPSSAASSGGGKGGYGGYGGYPYYPVAKQVSQRGMSTWRF